MILSCQNICKTFVEKPVLQNISFHLNENDRLAIIGYNGAGKSTLLKILIGEISSDDGEISLKKDASIGYLAQHQDHTFHHTIFDELLSVKKEVIELDEQMRTYEQEMKHLTGDALEQKMNQYTNATHKFEQLNGFAYKSDRFCEETNNQVVRLGNVKDDELRLNSNPVYVSDEYADDSSKAAIKVDDILFTMTGTRGKGDYFYTLIITEDDLKEKNLFLNQRVGCFRKAYHTVYMPYYNYLLKSPKIRERVFLYETGTANQGNIGIENINRIRLYNPPMKVQKNIVRMLNQKCNTIDSLITEKESLINDLEAYKKSLIYEVVTGKRRVV